MEIGMLDKDSGPKALTAGHLVPRSWFFGGFVLVAVLAIAQLAVSVVLLRDFEHEHALFFDGPMESQDYTFDHVKQQWASGPKGERPPGFDGMSWEAVIEKARGTTVTFAGDGRYMGTNYVPFLEKELRNKYDITLNYRNMPTAEAVAEATIKGGIDYIWLNKDNYFKLRDFKKQKLSWGPYANLIPNAALFDFQDPVISEDYGEPTNGEEMPLHIANFVMVYDRDNMPNPLPSTPFPPKNIGDLMSQVNKGEINFHPVDPANWLGTPFLEQVFYHFTAAGDMNKYREDFDETFWNDMKAIVFPKLKEFHKNLFVHKGQKYSVPPITRELFFNGTTHLSAEYAPGKVFSLVQEGAYPPKATSFMFDERMVSNTNFLTIVANGPNKPGAMVAINLASSLEHQYKRFIPNEGSWAALQAFSPSKSMVTNAGWNTVFDEIEALENAPTFEELNANRVGEFNKAYLTRMRDDFAAEIGVLIDAGPAK